MSKEALRRELERLQAEIELAAFDPVAEMVEALEQLKALDEEWQRQMVFIPSYLAPPERLFGRAGFDPKDAR